MNLQDLIATESLELNDKVICCSVSDSWLDCFTIGNVYVLVESDDFSGIYIEGDDSTHWLGTEADFMVYEDNKGDH